MAFLFGLRSGLVRSVALGFLMCGFGGLRGAVQTNPAVAPQQTIAEKIAASNGLLDINTATAEQLKALPGMGNAYVQRIVAGRPYTAKNQLTRRGILPAAEYERIKDQIIAHRPKP